MRAAAPSSWPSCDGRAHAARLSISGPNLHRLGKREPSIYGTETLDAIHERLAARGSSSGAR